MSGFRGAADRDARGDVLVTGSSTGIGHACAVHLARLGFRVYAGVRSESDAERLRAEATGELQPVTLDVTDDKQVAACAEAIGTRGGALAGVVNNAGIAVAGPLEAVPLAEFRRQIEVNLIGQVAVTHALLPRLRESRGRLIFVSSDNGRLAAPCLAGYSASKHAIEAIADALRLELSPFGVRVVLVEPGAIRTPMWERARIAAKALRESYPVELEAIYGPMADRVERSASRLAAGALPPERVARTIGRALTVKRPRTRYMIGREARTAAVAQRLLPDRFRDRLVARAAGLR